MLAAAQKGHTAVVEALLAAAADKGKADKDVSCAYSAFFVV